ncbi:hypothetical protein PCE1_002836 [Barthelona sp. PCE]
MAYNLLEGFYDILSMDKEVQSAAALDMVNYLVSLIDLDNKDNEADGENVSKYDKFDILAGFDDLHKEVQYTLKRLVKGLNSTGFRVRSSYGSVLSLFFTVYRSTLGSFITFAKETIFKSVQSHREQKNAVFGLLISILCFLNIEESFEDSEMNESDVGIVENLFQTVKPLMATFNSTNSFLSFVFIKMLSVYSFFVPHFVEAFKITPESMNINTLGIVLGVHKATGHPALEAFVEKLPINRGLFDSMVKHGSTNHPVYNFIDVSPEFIGEFAAFCEEQNQQKVLFMILSTNIDLFNSHPKLYLRDLKNVGVEHFKDEQFVSLIQLAFEDASIGVLLLNSAFNARLASLPVDVIDELISWLLSEHLFHNSALTIVFELLKLESASKLRIDVFVLFLVLGFFQGGTSFWLSKLGIGVETEGYDNIDDAYALGFLKRMFVFIDEKNVDEYFDVLADLATCRPLFVDGEDLALCVGLARDEIVQGDLMFFFALLMAVVDASMAEILHQMVHMKTLVCEETAKISLLLLGADSSHVRRIVETFWKQNGKKATAEIVSTLIEFLVIDPSTIQVEDTDIMSKMEVVDSEEEEETEMEEAEPEESLIDALNMVEGSGRVEGEDMSFGIDSDEEETPEDVLAIEKVLAEMARQKERRTIFEASGKHLRHRVLSLCTCIIHSVDSENELAYTLFMRLFELGVGLDHSKRDALLASILVNDLQSVPVKSLWKRFDEDTLEADRERVVTLMGKCSNIEMGQLGCKLIGAMLRLSLEQKIEHIGQIALWIYEVALDAFTVTTSYLRYSLLNVMASQLPYFNTYLCHALGFIVFSVDEDGNNILSNKSFADSLRLFKTCLISHRNHWKSDSKLMEPLVPAMVEAVKKFNVLGKKSKQKKLIAGVLRSFFSMSAFVGFDATAISSEIDAKVIRAYNLV